MDKELPKFYCCGCCDHYHRVDFDGDCRDDSARFYPDVLDEIYNGEWEEVEQEDLEEPPKFPAGLVR